MGVLLAEVKRKGVSSVVNWETFGDCVAELNVALQHLRGIEGAYIYDCGVKWFFKRVYIHILKHSLLVVIKRICCIAHCREMEFDDLRILSEIH